MVRQISEDTHTWLKFPLADKYLRHISSMFSCCFLRFSLGQLISTFDSAKAPTFDINFATVGYMTQVMPCSLRWSVDLTGAQAYFVIMTKCCLTCAAGRQNMESPLRRDFQRLEEHKSCEATVSANVLPVMDFSARFRCQECKGQRRDRNKGKGTMSGAWVWARLA